ncbi:mannosyl-glycoprotein endo-beta-N-acetylglucosamidase [Romboutsia maritimum]|uniref:Mannosyl-glycoprotein endo-beta-N-acetylglucosamidase n=1 Tax=Romboutsia maritimum TaxID=2020948 RepID=A0A371IWA5_9FIRM|nr:SH3 domain-containing protein [Romboutsia maritimum]RDY24755.1 mannosyl-glycoprotein endo-beta-N-acetylglucosamidase [Romboutsia maritimum]
MKKRIALATLAMLPMMFTNAHAAGETGIVTANSLNVRSKAGTNYSVLFTVKKDDVVMITDSSNGWYKIKTNLGKEGWASSNYIKKVNSSTQTMTQNKKQVSISRLNMRSGASTSYRVITVLTKGSTVEIMSESNGWAKIKYSGRLGYVSSEYLTTVSNNTSNNINSNTNSNINSNTNNNNNANNDTNNSTNTTSKTKQVNIASLNVRSGAGTNYNIVGKVSNGQKVNVILESNGWSKIKFNGKDAYVSSRYLKDVSTNTKPSTPSVPLTPSQPSTGTPEVKETKKVNTTSLNVRSGPGTSYSSIGKVYQNNEVGIISESNGWSKIVYNNKEAYASSQYLVSASGSNGSINNNTGNSAGGSQIVNGYTVNYKSLNYTLAQHVDKQYERASVGGNVIDSSKLKSEAVGQSRGFVPAGKDDIEYYVNPKNFTGSSKGMMQFLRIDSYKGGISVGTLNSYLNSLSSGNNVFYNQGAAFINAAQKYNIDLVYLVSHAMWETAYGKSTLAQGQTLTSYKGEPLSNPVKVYNFFGIGAIDKSANVSGAQAAYSNGWTSVEATIDGSAKWISQNYVKNSKYNQNTIYKMKWNYDYTWHQYATDVNWTNGISGVMNNLISLYGTGKNLLFEVPQYK